MYELLDDLQLALSLADSADVVTLERFRADDLVLQIKEDGSPCSDADRRVEDLLRERILKERPHHGFLGEESGEGERLSIRWIIDPIDGTKNYVRGVPIFATLIACQRSDSAEIGVVSAPALGRRWWAARGEGAFLNGRRLKVSSVSRLPDALVCYSSLRSWRARGLEKNALALLDKCGRTRGLGDFWMHMLVAEGAADVAIEPSATLWDLAAIQPIVEEAGGRFTDLAGVGAADRGTGVTSNGQLHNEVLLELAGASRSPNEIR
jgi:histidinol-phosphatase